MNGGLWALDVASGKGETLFPDHNPAFTELATSVVYSPDGKLVFTGDREGFLRYWELKFDNGKFKKTSVFRRRFDE